MDRVPVTVSTQVRGIRLQHFKAFENARLRLADPCILVGKNGSGKSTLLDAFDFVAEAVRDSLRIAMDRRGGLDGIRTFRPGRGKKANVSVTVELDILGRRTVYGFTLGVRPGGGGFEVKEEVLRSHASRAGFRRTRDAFEGKKGMSPVIDPESLVLPVIAGQRSTWKPTLKALVSMCVYTLSPDVIRQSADIGREVHLGRSGANTADALSHMERTQKGAKDIRWIVDHLAEITPGIKGVESVASTGRRSIRLCQETKWGEDVWYPASDMSDGTLRSLGVLLALRQRLPTSLVAIDEIEDSIHPSAMAVLLDAISVSAKKQSVLVTTHSPEVLSHPVATGERIRILQWEDGVSRIYHLSEETIDSLEPPLDVGMLLRSNALWPADDPCEVEGGFFEVQGG